MAAGEDQPMPPARFWAGRRVCVTGGTGFLGFHVVRQLLAQGAHVRVLALPARPDHPLHSLSSVELVNGDVRDAAVVRRAVAGCSVVFHTAGVVAVWGPALAQMWSVHEDGTRAVLRAAAAARIVHTSSIVTVGATPDGTPLDEDAPFMLAGLDMPYVHAKRSSEHMALEAAEQGQDVVVVNPAYLVGPEDYEGSIMGRLCVRFWKGRLLIAPPGGINLVDVRDAARGHLLAAQFGEAGRRYILGGEDHTFATFMDKLGQVAGFSQRLRPRMPAWALLALAGLAEVRARWTGKEPYPSLAHARMNRYCWFVRSDRACAELGYEARPVEQTLADTLAWFRRRRNLSLDRLNRWWMRPGSEARPLLRASRRNGAGSPTRSRRTISMVGRRG
jgi:dihydroflavonol-4-reductase